MGVWVEGKAPTDPAGKSFRIPAWHGLWNYCVHVSNCFEPFVISPELAKLGHTNSGYGLSAEASRILAEYLRIAIRVGHTKRYIEINCASTSKAWNLEAFTVADVLLFTDFLATCGGFEIQ